MGTQSICNSLAFFVSLQRTQMSLKDGRIKLMNQILNGIKVSFVQRTYNRYYVQYGDNSLLHCNMLCSGLYYN